MKKEHKEKIDKAITLCEDAYKKFFTVIDSSYDKQEATNIKYFLLENTVFAGGLFRSIFTDMPVNDVDIFFTTEDAAIEFQHMFCKENKVFTEKSISPNNTYMWKWKGNSTFPILSFITRKVGKDRGLINSFDFTFNRHVFSLNTFRMCFDVDTFEKKGAVILEDNSNLFSLYLRALRFQEEGFKITKHSMIELLARVLQKQQGNETPLWTLKDVLREANVGAPSMESKILKDNFQLSYDCYTRDHYYSFAKQAETSKIKEYNQSLDAHESASTLRQR